MILKRLVLLSFLIFISLAAFGQCYVSEYSSNRRILKVDGDYVVDYSSNRRIYKFENANRIISYDL